VSGLVVVLLGTDHHPFDRLVDWSDEVARRHPDLRIVVQHGETRAPRVAEGHDYLPHATIMGLLAEASAAVCHGGPGTIMDARGHGHLPICVPRNPSYGEHVDGHQQRFAAVAGRAGVLTAVETAEEFHTALDRVLAQGYGERHHDLPPNPATERARVRLAHELDLLVEQRSARKATRTRSHLPPARSLEV
jgi:UDP-N-acetylglucosamine transferase subunit ALG13